MLHQSCDIQIGVFQKGDGGGGGFAEVVRGNFGCHAHGNAACAVEQYHRQAGGQQRGFFKRAVIVGHEVGGALVDFGKQQLGDGSEPCFGIAHGCRAVAVARAEVADAVYQRIAHCEILRHPHHGFIGGRVAVRVVFAEDFADHARGLDGFCAVNQPHVAHGVKDAPLHGLLTVFHGGQGAPFDHAHGVFQIGAFGIMGEGEGIGHGEAGVCKNTLF